METGVIKEIKENNRVIVNLNIENDCTACSLSNNCINRKKDCENIIEAICNDNVKVGDRVIVDLSVFKKIFYMFLIFLFPILIIFFSYYLFKKIIANDFFVILLSFLMLVLYFIVMIIIYKIKPSFLKIRCYKVGEINKCLEK